MKQKQPECMKCHTDEEHEHDIKIWCEVEEEEQEIKPKPFKYWFNDRVIFGTEMGDDEVVWYTLHICKLHIHVAAFWDEVKAFKLHIAWY